MSAFLKLSNERLQGAAMDWPKNLKAGIFAATAFIALLTGPAYSQNSDSKVVVDPDTLYENKVLDRRYREMLNRQPDGKDPHDPWGSVRGSEKPKEQKKPSVTGAK
jgi:hypothetical protein